MGSETFRSQSNLWQWISNQNGIDIYRHKEDGRLAEKRRISVSQASIQEEMKIYDFRKHNQDALNKAYQAIVNNHPEQSSQTASICSNQHHYVDVYTERIVDRLSDLPQLSFPESLYVLKTALPAFEVIYKKNGGIHINPELIGFTQNGEAKVWVNQNWALNNPSHYIPTLKTLTKRQYYQQISPQYRDESQMIANLYSVIQDKTQNGTFPSPFKQQLKSRPRNFKEIKRFLKKYIENEQQNRIPASIGKNKLSSPSKNNQTSQNAVHNNQFKIGSSNQNNVSSYQNNGIFQSNLQSGLLNQPNSHSYQFSLPGYQSTAKVTGPTTYEHSNTQISTNRPSYISNIADASYQQPALKYKPFELISSTHNYKSNTLDIPQTNPLHSYLPLFQSNLQSDHKYQFKSYSSSNPNQSVITNSLASPLMGITKEQVHAQNHHHNLSENYLEVSHHSTYKMQGSGVRREIDH